MSLAYFMMSFMHTCIQPFWLKPQVQTCSATAIRSSLVEPTMASKKTMKAMKATKDSRGKALRAMQIFIKPMIGGRVLHNVEADDTIANVQETIQKFCGIQPKDQLLKFAGIKLEPVVFGIPNTLRDYRIHHGDTVLLRWNAQGQNDMEMFEPSSSESENF